MRNNITFEISPAQVESLAEKLPIENKIRLIRRLEKETSADRLDNLTGKMRRGVRKAGISGKDIDHICEEVKREYDEKCRRH